MWTDDLQVHGLKMFDCHADSQEVSRCHIRGESENPLHAGKKHRSEGSTLALKSRYHQKSQTRVSVVPQNDLCPPNIFLKKRRIIYVTG